MKKNLKIIVLTGLLLIAKVSGQTDNNIYNLLSNNLEVTDPTIQLLLEDISRDSIASYIQTLENFGTRFEIAENHVDVSEWIFNKFESFGYDNVEYDEFASQISFMDYDSTYTLKNIYCTLPGYGAPEEKFIMCAHYDSFCSNENPMQVAPGADDNASGTAALLEIARVYKLNNITPKRTIQFAALDGEELMASSYSGSAHLAENLSAQNENVKLVVNHDMIGFTNKSLEQSFVNINRHNNSEHFANLAINTIVSETKISAQHAQYWGADLRPFTYYGYYGIYFEETIFSPFYHTNSDTYANINIDYCTEVIKGSCATIIKATSMPSTVVGINTELVSNENSSVRFYWNNNHDFDFETFVFYYSTNNGNSFSATLTTDTSIVKSNISDFDNVKYAVVAMSYDRYESFASINDLKITSINDENDLQNDFYLSQNYPNPFNPTTTIEYRIPEAGLVKIVLYDVLGNTVSELVNENKTKGNHRIDYDAKGLSSGIYFYHLTSGKYSGSKKMILLK